MKLDAILAFATGALALPALVDNAARKVFAVTDYEASVSGGRAIYRFRVLTDPLLALATCYAAPKADGNRLVNVANTACSDPKVQFRLTIWDRGIGTILEVWREWDNLSGFAFGTYKFPENWFRLVSNTEVIRAEVYVGPRDFNITNVEDLPI